MDKPGMFGEILETGKSEKPGDKQKDNRKKSANPAVTQNASQKALGIAPKDPNAGKTPEELRKIEALRKQLHGQYYDKMVNPQKSPEEPVAEKIERQERQETWEL